MSVIAKGADVGYRLIIVHVRHHRQPPQPDPGPPGATCWSVTWRTSWHLLTDVDSDFHRRDNAANLLGNRDHRLLAVVKKNPYRLRRLTEWLDSAGETTLRTAPILIIDDEADQASIDVGRSGRTTRINGLIRQILEKPKVGYVAYTATPFANMLIDPAMSRGPVPPRLHRRPAPARPTTSDRSAIFGARPSTPTRTGPPSRTAWTSSGTVPDDELPDVQPPRGRGAVYDLEPGSPTACARPSHGSCSPRPHAGYAGIGNRHSTHAHPHLDARRGDTSGSPSPIAQLLTAWRRHASTRATTALDRLQAQWDDESGRVPPEDGPTGRPGASCRSTAGPLLDDTAIVIDNYRSTDRLNYPRRRDPRDRHRHRRQHAVPRSDPGRTRLQLLRPQRVRLRHPAADGSLVRLPARILGSCPHLDDRGSGELVLRPGHRRAGDPQRDPAVRGGAAHTRRAAGQDPHPSGDERSPPQTRWALPGTSRSASARRGSRPSCSSTRTATGSSTTWTRASGS